MLGECTGLPVVCVAQKQNALSWLLLNCSVPGICCLSGGRGVM